jgi:hypothetical protein
MTPESVCRILSAQHARPSFESIARIARAAGVSLGWIMEEPGFTLTDETTSQSQNGRGAPTQPHGRPAEVREVRV